ncbi:hypothetical protein HBI79_053520 [Parastagonospora nodorum]|nr:hypothetical protein HBI79_053520 [Parastagonospora nodorum]
MSVSVEQPLHFSQQPSSPSFSSPPRSPSRLPHAHSPAPQPPPPPADVDMNASTTTSAPVAQQHGQDDADMAEAAGGTGTLDPTNGHALEPPSPPNDRETANSAVAIQVAAVEEDVMDTTPDLDTDLVLEHDSTAQPDTIADPLVSATQEASATEPGRNNVDDPSDNVVTTDNAPPLDPPLPIDPLSHPPPPPPPIDPVRSESESSDDDDGLPPWHPIQEDTSSPDEDELKELEDLVEHSALDHKYWESKAFLPLEEPEYTAGETGHINWNIDAYNGTREKPNRDIVMTSDVVTVGGHQWQIKFYPKGNDSDYLSVYLECLSVMGPKKTSSADQSNETSNEDNAQNVEEKEHDRMETSVQATADATSPPNVPVDPQHAPLPLLDSKSVPKRKSVAAQVSVVLYNPTEPRVHYSKTALHRFCSGSPDWGWTRFHGPYYEIAHRMRGQRSALLRDDKLAFTAYIRIVEDETNCLWEHPNRENPWDSFAMTGLQSLILGEDASAPGGNMISAVISWLLFKPFRDVLYSIDVLDPEKGSFSRPKPLLTALQKVLYMLRTQVDPGAGPVPLDDVLDALEWYGIHDRLDKVDVVEVWEVLRAKLEEELQSTTHTSVLELLFGPKRDYATGVPKYRVPVVGVETMQTAVNSSSDFVVPGKPLPQLLTIELDRQHFDVKTRSYVKVLNKVTLDDHLTINGTSYTLYGFVVHKQTLQSYVYQPVIRPEGPGSRWYSYSDSKDENQVRCLTKRQAVNDHEGKSGKDMVVGNEAVAYIAMYVRDDVAHAAFAVNSDGELWAVPEWFRRELEKDKDSNDASTPPPPPADAPVTNSELDGLSQDNQEEESVSMFDFQVVDSRVFNKHDGAGNFDAYSPVGETNMEHVFSIQLSSDSGCDDIVQKLLPLFPDVKDPRQILFWFLDPARGTLNRPQFLGTGKILYSRGTYDRYTETKHWTLANSPSASRRIWVHVLDFDTLPELPKPKEEQLEREQPMSHGLHVEEVTAEASNGEGEEANAVQTQTTPRTQDTPMSEPGESQVALVESDAPQVEAVPVDNVDDVDTAIVEVQSADVPDPPAVDVLVSEELMAPGDTEMGGTQEDLHLPPPPPPPVDVQPEITEPPPPQRSQTPDPPPDEIYFFLKLWNPDKQALEPRGSHVSLTSARVDETVVTLLGLPVEDKKKIELWEEEDMTSARMIKHRRSFAQLDLRNTAIIIVSMPTTPEQRAALADRAAFADPSAYLKYRAFARNFPNSLNGYFTYNYFSSQYYKGEVTNGHRHGHGTLIYHSGATYSGSFRLGQCHGHGVYTFQNGDTYDGDWVDGQQHGSGTFVEAATGNTYVGGWKNDKKFGEGVTHWKNAQEAERMCRICWDEPAEAAFYDCGHVVACLMCAREVQNCPVCRKRVLTAMKLYYVA